jgi:DNA-binding protein HU-beta
MTKTELIQFIAEECNFSKADASRALDATLKGIQESVVNGDGLQIPGFGSFTVKERAARTGRNPQTGAEMQIPASKSVAFKNGKALKDAVNS